jgi:hypothetical protein
MRRDAVVEQVLRCYPTWWRARFEQEVRSVAEDLLAEGLGKTLQMLGSTTDFPSCSVETRIEHVRQFTPDDR